MGNVFDLAAARAARPASERTPSQSHPKDLAIFPAAVSHRRWLLREAHKIRAGVSKSTFRAAFDHIRGELERSGVPHCEADAEAQRAIEWLTDRVELLRALDDVPVATIGLDPGGRRA